MATTIKLRRGTAAEWASANPILAEGEPAYEADTGILKVGNGTDVYASLPGIAASQIAVNPTDTSTLQDGTLIARTS